MTRKDLKTIKQIACIVIKEQPVWISDLINTNQDDLKRLGKILKKEGRNS